MSLRARHCSALLPASTGKTRGTGSTAAGTARPTTPCSGSSSPRVDTHPAARAYVERRTAEGLSKKEIIGCLKGYVAREVYPSLRARG